MIIGINGLIGSGKDEIAKIIQYLDVKNTYKSEIFYKNFMDYNESKWKVKKWAGKLKQIASILTGIPIQNFENQEFKKSQMESMWGITYREFLQRIGGEGFRDNVHKDIWVNALLIDYIPERKQGGFERVVKSKEGIPIDFEYEVEYPNWIITDTRFPNEAKAIKDRSGLLLRVIRPNVEKSLHSSEVSLDSYNFDYEIINDGNIEDLIEKVKVFMNRCKL